MMRFQPGCRLLVIFLLTWTGAAASDQTETPFPPIVNTQKPGEEPPTPEEAWHKITVPAGFQVTLFAGEPDVQQPIGMSLDDRGRLWVAESYTYAADNPTEKRWDKKFRDRVLIFEDTNNDGRFDKRTVFWDQARNLSSVCTGFGGVWVLCAPNLLFIPDRNGDDVPDGPPEVVLDGWAVEGIGHNIVNGLMWGPDGWLYGRHGIMDTSHVGCPGTPDDQRTKINCGIWRYHPTKKTFEVVCHGTTNPWGLDYDDHGQLFFTNNVNGHFFHAIPGAHFIRMYGEDFNPHLYQLIDKHSDHDHWDSQGKSWQDSRDTSGKHGELGGGHSHVGAMIYLGDNWPEKYRNTVFMCNTHGRRINNDKLVRKGSGYVASHGEDFLFANNPWFRGITLLYGPDGGVYLSDWTDLGECHDHDGVHRTSGRIYKITHGKPKRPGIADVSKLANEELVSLQLHRNDWFVRTARRVLQERAAAGQDMKTVHAALVKMYDSNPDLTRKLRALWALYSTGGTTENWLRQQLQHDSEHVRAWAIRLLVDDNQVSPEALQDLVTLAKHDASGLVRLYLASSLQRMPLAQRPALAAALLAHGEDAGDHNMPLLLWYGIEPLVPVQPQQALQLADKSQIPLVRRFIARRLTVDLAKSPAPVNALVELAANNSAPEMQLDILQGMSEALQGLRKATPPPAWTTLQPKLAGSGSAAVRDQVRRLGVVFGDGRALEELYQLVRDRSLAGDTRRSALQVLIEARARDLFPLLKDMVGDRVMSATALRGLGSINEPSVPELILGRYRQLKREEKSAAIEALVSRPAYAEALLHAIYKGWIPRADVSAYHARQIHSFGNTDLNKQLAAYWGEIHTSSAEKKQQITRYKNLLTPDRLKQGEAPRGRLLFQKNCANCHKLFGEGQVIGPDLTGSNRDSLDYLLENIIDPSSVVPVNFKMSVITLKDGRVLNGVVINTTGRILTVQTQNEQIKLDRNDVEEMQGTPVSLMPEGMLTTLSEAEVCDLITYLMSRRQVPLPMEARQK